MGQVLGPIPTHTQLKKLPIALTDAARNWTLLNAAPATPLLKPAPHCPSVWFLWTEIGSCRIKFTFVLLLPSASDFSSSHSSQRLAYWWLSLSISSLCRAIRRVQQTRARGSKKSLYVVLLRSVAPDAETSPFTLDTPRTPLELKSWTAPGTPPWTCLNLSCTLPRPPLLHSATGPVPGSPPEHTPF